MAWDEYTAPSGGGTNLNININFPGGNALSGALTSSGMNYVTDEQYQAVVDALTAAELISTVVITDNEVVTRVMTATPSGDE